jgi:amino acid transporter
MNFSRGLVELFTFILLLATLSTLVPYTFCSLAGVILHRRERTMSWSTGASIVSGLAFIFALFAIGGAGPDVVFWGFLLLLAGLPVYAYLGRYDRFKVQGSGFTVQSSAFRVHSPSSTLNPEP